MKLLSKLMLFVSLVLCFANVAQVFAEITSFGDLNEFEVLGEKIYVQPEQVQIANEGILIQSLENSFFVNQLNYDLQGLFFLTSDILQCNIKCPNGHMKTCRNCNGCNGWSCRYRCRCKDRR